MPLTAAPDQTAARRRAMARLEAAASILRGAIKRNVPEGDVKQTALAHVDNALAAAIEGVRAE